MERQPPGPWEQELNAFVRAFSGAFLFAIPLLFTMEMWFIGTFADMWKLVTFLVLALFANLGLNYFAGFKTQSTFASTINQTVDAVAVGVVASAIVLLVLGRITPGDPLDSILGKVIIQAVPLSIGASVANAIFSDVYGRSMDGGQSGGRGWRITLNDLGATGAGAVFIGFSIAPTDEVPMLAAELEPGNEAALIGLSLIITYAIVFASGFDPERPRQRGQALFRHPAAETAMAYLVSLAVAAAVLYLFDRVEFGDPPTYVLSQTLVLGLPAAIGGAAGRLVI